MAITVQGPGGFTIDFPDGTDGDTINRVMSDAVSRSQTSSKSDEDLMVPQPTGSAAIAAQQDEMKKRAGVLPGAPKPDNGPRMGDTLRNMFGGHNPIAETYDNFVKPALDALPFNEPTPRTQAEKKLQDFQNSRGPAERFVTGPSNYAGDVMVRALTQGQYGVGDVFGKTAGQSAEDFERANAPQLEALQKAGDLAAGTAGVEFARPLRPSPEIHRPELPTPRAQDATADLAAFKDAGVRPFGPAFSSGPMAGVAKSLADTPIIGAPVRNALEESIRGAKGVSDDIASRFGNAATEEQAGRVVQEGIERYKDARPDDVVREQMKSDASASRKNQSDDWAPEPPVEQPATTFKTAKGSTYEVQPGGTTIRNKAARNEPGHEGDEGLQPRSHRTVYVTPEDANKLGEVQGTYPDGVSAGLGFTKDGRIGVKYSEGPSAGKFERRTAVNFSDQPKVGHIPVELWNDGSRVHFGNEITEVRQAQRFPRQAPDQWRRDIIAAPSRETSRKTKAEALYDEAWNHIPPEMQIGRSREGDSRFLGGLGNTANELDKIIDRNLGMMNRTRAEGDGTVEVTRAGQEVAPVGRQVSVRGGKIPEAALPALGGQLGRILRDIAGRSWRGTLQDMRELRSALRRLSSGMQDTEKNTLSKSDVERLRAAVSRDMQYTLERNAKTYAANGQRQTAVRILRSAQLFKRADDFYRLSQARLDVIEKLFSAKSPEAVYKNVAQAAQIKGGDLAKLRALAKVLRSDERAEFASGVLSQLGRPIASARGFSQEIGFSVTSWLTNWNKMSPEAKRLIFGDQHALALDKLARVARRLADVEAQVNSSRSGTHLTNIAGIASAGTALATGNILPILGPALSGYTASLLLSRPAYATWATRYAVLRAHALSGPRAAIRPLHEQIHRLAIMAEADPRLIPVVIAIGRDNGMNLDPNDEGHR